MERCFQENHYQNIKKTYKTRFKKKNDLIVAIGPCISQKNYEVGREFKYNFILKNHKNKNFFKSKNKRIYFNLSGFIENQLIDMV